MTDKCVRVMEKKWNGQNVGCGKGKENVKAI